MKIANEKSALVSSGSLEKRFEIVIVTQARSKRTHHPTGKLKVMLSLDSSPYLMYPKNPTNAYIAVTMIIPMFNTPQVPPNDFGCSMLFSNAMTTPTASRANRTVPK